VFVVNRPKNYLFVVVFGCGIFCFGFWLLFLSYHIVSYIIYPFAVQEEEEEEPTRLHHIIITLCNPRLLPLPLSPLFPSLSRFPQPKSPYALTLALVVLLSSPLLLLLLSLYIFLSLHYGCCFSCSSPMALVLLSIRTGAPGALFHQLP
jgi:hypothetical protein